MQRLLYHGGCDPANGPAPKLKIRPATFATTTEAWNYFVRHPEDFPLIDEEDDENNLRLDLDSQTMDNFDYLDMYMNGSDHEPLSKEAAPAASPTQERDSVSSSEESDDDDDGGGEAGPSEHAV